MNSAEVLIKFKGDSSSVDKTTKNVTSSFGSMTKAFTLGSLASKAVSKGMQLISQNMDAAISRVDTMNNFPKVMKNLGISVQESDKAIKKMSEKLQGLPTTLNDGAMAVQRFTSANGDIKKSTDMFLAVNNAILAGGASAQIQASALEQLSQSYSKGKMDMMEWRTLQTAMPAQLKQVATAMGLSTDELGEMMRQGDQTKETIDQFIGTIMQLNTEGANGFASFEEQARGATGGIETSITNMKTAFARGVGDMISKVNEALKPYGGLNGVISSIGKTGEQVFKKIGSTLTNVIPKLISFGKWIGKHKTLILALSAPILAIITAIKTYNTIMTVATAVQAAYNAVMMANPIVLIISAIVAAIALLVAGFLYLWKHSEKFRNFWKGLWEGIKNVVSTIVNTVVNIFKTVINFVKNNWKGILLFLVNPFAGAFKLLYDNCEGFRNFINTFIQNVISFVQSIPARIGQIVQNIINFIKNIPNYIGYAIGWIVGKIVKFYTVDIPNFVKAVITWVKSLPEKIWNLLVEFGTKLAIWILTTKDNVINKTKEIVNNVATWFKQLPNKIKTTFTQVITAVGTWLTNMYNKCKTGITNLVKSIVNWFKNLPNKMLNIGKNIVTGIWNGIKNAKSWLTGKIKDFGKNIMKGFKDALKIGSPSKLAEKDVGQWIPKGIAVGIDANADSVYKSMKNLVTGMGLNPQLTSSMQNSFSPTVQVYNNVNVEQDPLGQMVSNIKTFSGGAKNDYNYGSGI